MLKKDRRIFPHINCRPSALSIPSRLSATAKKGGNICSATNNLLHHANFVI